MSEISLGPQYPLSSGQFYQHQKGPVVLEVIGLCKSFGALRVLDKISLKLNRGSFHALFGGNGAGKSTLNKSITFFSLTMCLFSPSYLNPKVTAFERIRETLVVGRNDDSTLLSC
jgi:ABC-type microcin C transport system duplicated ATPase subunit YejF